MRVAVAAFLLAASAQAGSPTWCAEEEARCLKEAEEDPCPKRERRVCALERAVCEAQEDAKDAARARLWEYREANRCASKGWL